MMARALENQVRDRSHQQHETVNSGRDRSKVITIFFTAGDGPVCAMTLAPKVSAIIMIGSNPKMMRRVSSLTAIPCCLIVISFCEMLGHTLRVALPPITAKERVFAMQIM
jgi:hypothetical protein